MVCCFWIGTPVYQQWYTKPTIITISDTNYPVWHIHFPAITICSNIRIIKSKLTQEVQDIYGPGFINKYYYGTAEEKAECNEPSSELVVKSVTNHMNTEAYHSNILVCSSHPLPIIKYWMKYFIWCWICQHLFLSLKVVTAHRARDCNKDNYWGVLMRNY